MNLTSFVFNFLLDMHPGVRPCMPAAALLGLLCRDCLSRVRSRSSRSFSSGPRTMTRWNSQESSSAVTPQENPRVLITGEANFQPLLVQNYLSAVNTQCLSILFFFFFYLLPLFFVVGHELFQWKQSALVIGILWAKSHVKTCGSLMKGLCCWPIVIKSRRPDTCALCFRFAFAAGPRLDPSQKSGSRQCLWDESEENNSRGWLFVLEWTNPVFCFSILLCFLNALTSKCWLMQSCCHFFSREVKYRNMSLCAGGLGQLGVGLAQMLR